MVEPMEREPHPQQGRHILDERLAMGSGFRLAERVHLLRCAACRRVLNRYPANTPNRRSAWLAAGAMMVGIFALWYGPRLAGCDPRFGGRIEPSKERAELVVSTYRPGGRVYGVAHLEALSQANTLEFSYSNPQGTHQSLTVLAWDGDRLFWYSPKKRGALPQKLNGGSRWLALNFSLKHHRPGHLTVVAAFDADPEAVANTLMAGAPVEGATTLTLEVIP